MNRNGQGLHARRRRRRVGFTLMELLLVLMILVVLASMAVTTFSGTQENALKSAAKGQVGLFKSAVNLYKFELKEYPPSLNDLVKRPSDSRGRRPLAHISRHDRNPARPVGPGIPLRRPRQAQHGYV